MNTSIPALQEFQFTANPQTQSVIDSYIKRESVDNIRRHYHNGLSKYIQQIKIEIVNDTSQCKKWWNYFSPNKSLFDLWSFRMCFSKGYRYKHHFIVIRKDNEPVGLLPLDYDERKNCYLWFGGEWQEDNVFFVSNPNYVPLLLFLAPEPIALYGIKTDSIDQISKFEFESCDPKYILSLDSYGNLDEYLKSLKKKKRHNLTRDIKRIESLHPEIRVGNLRDFNTVNKIIKKRFHAKGELTDWEEEPPVLDAFKNILNLKSSDFQTKVFSIYIDGECAASDVNLIYNDTYCTLRGGSNVDKFPGIGNYLFAEEIRDAINEGSRQIDFFQGDYGWKHKWFEEVPLLRYTRGI